MSSSDISESEISSDYSSGSELSGNEEAADNAEKSVSTGEEDKGKTIIAQFGLWDGLLDVRMKQQQMLVEVNQLPQPAMFPKFAEEIGDRFTDSADRAQQSLKKLLDELTNLQHHLFRVDGINEKCKNVRNTKTGDDDEEITSSSDSEPEKNQADKAIDQCNSEIETDLLEDRNSVFEKFRNDTLLSSWRRVNQFSKASKDFKSFSISILDQIKQILDDKSRLLERSRLNRSSLRVLGKENSGEMMDMGEEETSPTTKIGDPETFDDGDFYHQLLIETTKRRTNNMSDLLVVSKHWAEIGRMRKHKKKVDQKASKGRRTRYNIHKKLVNFMAPVQNHNKWTKDQRDGLYRELFKSNVSNDNTSNWMFV